MSLAKRQKTCAACGKPLEADRPVSTQVIVDDVVRYVVVHDHCSVYCMTKGKTDARPNQVH